MKTRIPLAGMPNQRNLDSLQALIEGKDQRLRSVIVVPIRNPLTGEVTHYVEKRPGFEISATPGAAAGEAILFSRTTNKTITAFGDDVFVDNTSVGDTFEFNNNVLLQCRFDNNDPADISVYEASETHGTATFVDERAVFEGGDSDLLTYTGTGIGVDKGTKSWTMECFPQIPNAVVGSQNELFFVLLSQGTDIRLTKMQDAADPAANKIRLSEGATPAVDSDDVFPSIETHFALMYRGTEDGAEHVWMFFDGVQVADYVPAAGVFNLPTAGTPEVRWGSNPGIAGTFYIADLRIKEGMIYDPTGFTAPTRPLPLPYI